MAKISVPEVMVQEQEQMNRRTLRLLFVGESWLGSNARSLKEALLRTNGLVLDEVNEDLYIPRAQTLLRRIANRFIYPLCVAEFECAIVQKCNDVRPDAIIVYKGAHVSRELLVKLGAYVDLRVNIYPDYSPHAYGPNLQHAMGGYDLVISTKPFHPPLWKSVYGYTNVCTFVAHGYDPSLHLVARPQESAVADVVMAATWRPEYGELIHNLGLRLEKKGVTVAIAGAGWTTHARAVPKTWVISRPRHGTAYVDWIRSGRVCIAPLNRSVVIGGEKQPGDEDSSRSYEIAAAHSFFLHQRTSFIQTQYNEASEVPMFDGPAELAEQILKFLPDHKRRAEMAASAHRRAVPMYSMDARARDIVKLINTALL